MDATLSPPPVSSSYRAPLRERLKVNVRLLVMLAVVGLPIGWVVYQYVSASLNHGVAKQGDLYAVDLKALGNFPFDEKHGTVNDIPPDYRKLDGKKVALEGFMYAGSSAADEINRFQFVYNIQKCCFGGPPRVQERVFTVVPSGTVPYYGEMVRCTGTLHVGVLKNDTGTADAIYTMVLDKVDQL